MLCLDEATSDAYRTEVMWAAVVGKGSAPMSAKERLQILRKLPVPTSTDVLGVIASYPLTSSRRRPRMHAFDRMASGLHASLLGGREAMRGV
ncbi:hypothetical protein MTO96_024259 [Rhipicephalus appendiculatus]